MDRERGCWFCVLEGHSDGFEFVLNIPGDFVLDILGFDTIFGWLSQK